MVKIKVGQKLEIEDGVESGKWHKGTITSIKEVPPAKQYEITCEGEAPELVLSIDFDDYVEDGFIVLKEG